MSCWWVSFDFFYICDSRSISSKITNERLEATNLGQLTQVQVRFEFMAWGIQLPSVTKQTKHTYQTRTLKQRGTARAMWQNEYRCNRHIRAISNKKFKRPPSTHDGRDWAGGDQTVTLRRNRAARQQAVGKMFNARVNATDRRVARDWKVYCNTVCMCAGVRWAHDGADAECADPLRRNANASAASQCVRFPSLRWIHSADRCWMFTLHTYVYIAQCIVLCIYVCTLANNVLALRVNAHYRAIHTSFLH